MIKSIYPILIFFVVLLTWVWLIFNKDDSFHPFPFYKCLEVTKRFYFFLLFFFTLPAALSFILFMEFKTVSSGIIFSLFFFEIFSYMLNYNQPVGYIKAGQYIKNIGCVDIPSGWFIPVSYPALMLLICLILAVIEGIKIFKVYLL